MDREARSGKCLFVILETGRCLRRRMSKSRPLSEMRFLLFRSLDSPVRGSSLKRRSPPSYCGRRCQKVIASTILRLRIFYWKIPFQCTGDVEDKNAFCCQCPELVGDGIDDESCFTNGATFKKRLDEAGERERVASRRRFYVYRKVSTEWVLLLFSYPSTKWYRFFLYSGFPIIRTTCASIPKSARTKLAKRRRFGIFRIASSVRSPIDTRSRKVFRACFFFALWHEHLKIVCRFETTLLDRFCACIWLHLTHLSRYCIWHTLLDRFCVTAVSNENVICFSVHKVTTGYVTMLTTASLCCHAYDSSFMLPRLFCHAYVILPNHHHVMTM